MSLDLLLLVLWLNLAGVIVARFMTGVAQSLPPSDVTTYGVGLTNWSSFWIAVWGDPRIPLSRATTVSTLACGPPWLCCENFEKARNRVTQPGIAA